MESGDRQRILDRIEQWKRNLIDLTFRNRLLNYRPRKRSTVEIVDEYPQQVLYQLIEGESFRFDPRPEEQEEDEEDTDDESEPSSEFAHSAAEDQTEFLEEEEEQIELTEEEAETEVRRRLETGLDLKRVDDEELEDFHTDDRLQTQYTDKRLNNKLLRLYRTAQSNLREQGVNNLHLALGMLEWYESPDSEDLRRSPILLVPSALSRKTARSGFRLSLGEGEPILNPALTEKLDQEFRIDLPSLPELTDISAVDFEEVLFGVKEAVTDYDRWRVTRDPVLGLFSFHKYLMYRDLDEYTDMFVEDERVQGICGIGTSEVAAGLPEDVRDADLDEEMAPWKTTQVVDADTSQQQAILAVKKGHDLVLEGPPGTGKSQTITNLIAEAMTDGQSVLFVSEKMAALEVVESRLESVGLGDYCIELHSNKTNKNRFTNDLAASLDRDRPEKPERDRELRKLRRRTDQLNSYVMALHDPVEPLGWSPYQAIGRLTEVEDAPLFSNAEVSRVLDVSAEDFDLILEALGDLKVAYDAVAPISDHPLRGIGLQRAPRTIREHVREDAAEALETVDQLTEAARTFADDFGLAVPETLGDVHLMLDAAEVLRESPGAERSVLENEAWNQLSTDAEELLTAGETYEETRDHIRGRLEPEVLDADLQMTTIGLENYLEDGLLRFFKPGYWSVRSDARSWYVPGDGPDGDEGAVRDLRAASRCSEARTVIQDRDELGRDLFGRRWNGPASNWKELRDFANWMVEVRKYVLEEVLTSDGLEVAAGAEADEEDVVERGRTIRQLLAAAKSDIDNLREEVEAEEDFPIAPSADQDLEQASDALSAIEQQADHLRRWTTFVDQRERCLETRAASYLGEALSNGVDPDSMVSGFERLFFQRWLEEVCDEREVLGEFRSNLHESRVEEFRELDELSKEIARDRARYELASQRDTLLESERLRGQHQYLNQQAALSRQIDPIRAIFREAAEAVQLIKPCVMMSPLSVAKYLEPDAVHFDLLIFDEASQITPEDAVGPFIRADQVVIVGDSKQLPPTNFFSAQVEDPERIEPGQLRDMENILDQVETAGTPTSRLKWHYRSRDESLINYSNTKFYDGELRTFPSRFQDDDSLGVQFEHLDHVTYEGGGRNQEEAEKVVDAVIDHIKAPHDFSLGVGTFGMKQQTLIQDLLEERRRRDPSIEPFFQHDGEESFFVKNLESIQGDDRDVIFISVTYGPGEDGRVRRQFGPINGPNGWRRLNVITTRAKYRLKVFSSMRGEDIDVSGNVSEGVGLLRDYLLYAETGRLPTADVIGAPQEPDSPFERSVIEALERRGYETRPQVGESGYRIDIGVVDPDEPGRFLCGVECDGATYHSSATARERDRLRQQVLESRGWTILRVWSTDWFHDRQAQIERLTKAIERAREEADEGHPALGADKGRARETVEPEENDDEDQSAETLPEARESDPSGEEEKPDLSEIPVQQYELVEPNRIRSDDSFYNGGIKNIARIAERIVEQESPIHEEDLKRRTMQFWGFDRLGSNISARIGRAIGHLVRKDRLIRRGDFLWDPEMDRPPVRSRDIADYNFDPSRICYEEAAEAVRLLLEHRAPLRQDEIPTEAVRLLGFQRAGSNLQELIKEATKKLIEEGELRPGGYGISLAQ